jgi:hypothetical protein
VPEAWKRQLFGTQCAADRSSAFDDEHAQPGFRQPQGGTEPVVARPDNDHIVVRHERMLRGLDADATPA